MCERIFPILALAIEVWCVVVTFTSIWSWDWYTGDGGSYGIATACYSDEPRVPVQRRSRDSFMLTGFCDINWNDYEFTQKVTVSLIFAASIFGIVVLSLMTFVIICRCWFKPTPGGHNIINYLCFFQFLSIACGLVALSGYYQWSTPPDTSVGPMFYLVGTACFGAMINMFLLSCSHDMELHAQNKAIGKAKYDKEVAEQIKYRQIDRQIANEGHETFGDAPTKYSPATKSKSSPKPKPKKANVNAANNV